MAQRSSPKGKEAKRRTPKGKVDRFDEIELSGYETVRPTPDILDALDQDYPLEASVADLVDNSIDAGARNVLVRFVRNSQRLVSLCVADDGRGMAEQEATRAMRFAARRSYGKKDIGMFGVGLKTASLSQAETVLIASRIAAGSAVGRRWTKSGIKEHDWRLDIVKSSSAALVLAHDWGTLGEIGRGTVVRWDGVYDFERLHTGIDEYLENAIAGIRRHLGLKLHRFLVRKRIRILVDVEDVELGEIGPPSQVLAMNPFPPAGSSGAPGYPKDFTVEFPQVGKVRMRAHIWRKKSRDEGYRLGGGQVAEHQGFYFFRHDRLIQDGGWCGVIGTNEPHMSLARVEVDIPDQLKKYIKVRSNKAGVDVPATFGPAVLAARARDGTVFPDFLKRADEVYRRRAEQRLRPMVHPGGGIPAEVRKALEKRSIHFLRGQKCSISWASLPGAGFLSLHQDDRRIILNSRYRKMLLRNGRGSSADLPLLRTLLYFLFESLLAGARIGPVERLRLDAIKASLNAALKLEHQWTNE